MGLLQRFFNSDYNILKDEYAQSPEGQIRSNNSKAKEDNFQNSDLDLENPSPLGGPINVPYVTRIGSETKEFTTTQPYTPKNTYRDNLQSKELIKRASDLIK